MTDFRIHLEKAFDNAENGISKLPKEILSMEGFSGLKTRHFYNNLLNMENVSYLEIGTWKGSSVCSAMYGNKAKVVCMDNWSEYGKSKPKYEFLCNFHRYKGENDAIFIEGDCFTVDVSKLPKFNIYMYDGEHSEINQYKALSYFYPCLEDTFIYVVDDWNCKNVRAGTIRGIKELPFDILYEKEIRLTDDDTHTPMEQARTGWWNGMYVVVLSKKHI